MNAKRIVIITKILFMLNYGYLINAQVEKIEPVVSFGNRLKTPIEMDVKQDVDKIIMNVNNKSYYPYNFIITFGEFQNLSPRIFEQKVILTPGINRLFVFKIVDPRESPRLSYKISYYMSCTSTKSDLSFPYLIPVGWNKPVKLESTLDNNFVTYYEDNFMMDQGDTVFASRKGFVTALPADKSEVERIVNWTSLEIRHDDATTAVYVGLDPEKLFIKLGQQVFPGQPLGIIASPQILKFRLFELQSEGRVKNININYSGPDNQVIKSNKINGVKAVYQEAVIKKEMTKREISKFDKGSLY